MRKTLMPALVFALVLSIAPFGAADQPATAAARTYEQAVNKAIELLPRQGASRRRLI